MFGSNPTVTATVMKKNLFCEVLSFSRRLSPQPTVHKNLESGKNALSLHLLL